jgi:hypothetical protein
MPDIFDAHCQNKRAPGRKRIFSDFYIGLISRAIKISDCAKMTISMIKMKKMAKLNKVPE